MSWRLNERHYGALQGLNKSETARQYGDDQILVWRRSYDTPPPALEASDERNPVNDPRYQSVARDLLPLTECLKDTVARFLPYWNETIAPQVKTGQRVITEALQGVDFFIHKPEGAIFLWLWFRDLPIASRELYERLKRRKVIVVPGEYFFPGLTEPWRHRQECIRMNYAQDPAAVEAGIQIIAEEVRRAYAEGHDG